MMRSLRVLPCLQNNGRPTARATCGNTLKCRMAPLIVRMATTMSFAWTLGLPNRAGLLNHAKVMKPIPDSHRAARPAAASKDTRCTNCASERVTMSPLKNFRR